MKSLVLKRSKGKAQVVSLYLSKDFLQALDKIAKERHLSRGKALEFIVRDRKWVKDKNEMLKALIAMAQDRDFQEEQIRDAEEDLLAESKYNPNFLDEW